MNLVRYEPFNIFNSLNDELNTLLRRPQARALSAGNTGDTDSRSRWAPAVDVNEESERFVLRVDVPGVDPKDIDVTVDDDVLVIKGERKLDSTDEQDGFKRIERVQGSFFRSFNLPETADPDSIDAQGSNGVLTVTIAKKEKAQPRKIAVAA